MYKIIIILVIIPLDIALPLANAESETKDTEVKKDHVAKLHHTTKQHMEAQFTIPPVDYSSYKHEKTYKIENLLFCEENYCNKIQEFYVSSSNKFKCTERYLEIWYKYKDSQNVIREKLGYLTNFNNVSNFQVEGKCLRIKKYEI